MKSNQTGDKIRAILDEASSGDLVHLLLEEALGERQDKGDFDE